MADSNTSPSLFEQIYPHVSEWVKSHGWIEIGYDDYSHTFVRVLDIGGMLWEGEEDYPPLDASFQAIEVVLSKWMEESGFD